MLPIDEIEKDGDGLLGGVINGESVGDAMGEVGPEPTEASALVGAEESSIDPSVATFSLVVGKNVLKPSSSSSPPTSH
jgi:hypothetical protein